MSVTADVTDFEKALKQAVESSSALLEAFSAMEVKYGADTVRNSTCASVERA